MKSMNTVWVLTGLWASFISIPLYLKMGRTRAVSKTEAMDMKSKDTTMSAMNMKSKDSSMPAMDMKPKDSPMPAMDMNMDMDMDMGNMKVDNKETSTMSDMSAMSSENMNMPGMNSQGMGKHPMWESVFLSALHCGAGCTLADIVGEGIGYVFREHIKRV